ncbi:MAG: sulfatase, partial [Armatimonadetes bacterium]|nr:sulfatase [Armatimonadota bacterium]
MKLQCCEGGRYVSGKKTGVRVWPAVLLAGMLTAATARPGPAQGRPERPNVIFILADDLGWSDTTLYGTTALYQTPNLERLARRGMRFRRAYTANPLCSPTRASILTGLYPGRIGITAPACHLPEERFDAVLTPRPQPFHRARGQVSATRLKHEYVTLAERFQSAGYRTAHFGKWHLGREPYHPQSQGFEVDWPGEPSLPGPAGGYLAPWRFVRRAELQGKPGEHIEDRMAAEAARFIQQHREQPFYLNYWAYSVHSPWSAKPELVERYRSRVRPDAPQRNPLYAAMVQSLDDAVRTLLDAVDRAGIAERTILVFFSDNGGWIWNPRATSPPGYETIPATSNAPLRGGKATLYEGGTRVPCVVVWPGVTRPNSRMDALFSSVDWHPTLLTMAGLPPAPGRQLDGVNQERVLRGKAPARDTLFCFFPHYTPATENIPGTWIRQERWKLIRFHHDSESQEDRFELYDLREDPGETRNLAGVEPARVQELNRRIETHLTEIGALVPDRNPGFRKDARPGEPAAAGPAIRGWTAVRDCTLAHRNGALIVTSTGGDPHLSTRFDPVPAGE